MRKAGRDDVERTFDVWRLHDVNSEGDNRISEKKRFICELLEQIGFDGSTDPVNFCISVLLQGPEFAGECLTVLKYFLTKNYEEIQMLNDHRFSDMILTLMDIPELIDICIWILCYCLCRFEEFIRYIDANAVLNHIRPMLAEEVIPVTVLVLFYVLVEADEAKTDFHSECHCMLKIISSKTDDFLKDLALECMRLMMKNEATMYYVFSTYGINAFMEVLPSLNSKQADVMLQALAQITKGGLLDIDARIADVIIHMIESGTEIHGIVKIIRNTPADQLIKLDKETHILERAIAALEMRDADGKQKIGIILLEYLSSTWRGGPPYAKPVFEALLDCLSVFDTDELLEALELISEILDNGESDYVFIATEADLVSVLEGLMCHDDDRVGRRCDRILSSYLYE